MKRPISHHKVRPAIYWQEPPTRSRTCLNDTKKRGLTMPLLWPPFADVPVSKTLDDLKRLKEEIMPKVDSE